jgi:hypothetical protein
MIEPRRNEDHEGLSPKSLGMHIRGIAVPGKWDLPVWAAAETSLQTRLIDVSTLPTLENGFHRWWVILRFLFNETVWLQRNRTKPSQESKVGSESKLACRAEITAG